MAEESKLEPVFIPSLAELLARAEKSKGSALSEAEMHRIRDGGVCMMMPAEQVRRMEQSRGYRDVHPENCLADWHRMRGGLAGHGYLPKLILCLPGGDDFEVRSTPILAEAGVEHEFRGHDARMVQAFRASRRGARPSLPDPDFDAIGRHSTVLYVVSRNYHPPQAPGGIRDFLRLGRRLLEAGALGIKCESSGIAHAASSWTKWSAEAEEGGDHNSASSLDFWAVAYFAFVQPLIQSDADFHSCGMHLLGQPDLIVSRELMSEKLAVGKSAEDGTADLFDGFGIYVLAECNGGGFTSGHTFSLNAASRRYRVIWEPCTGYDEDEFFFNPYGRWRFVNP